MELWRGMHDSSWDEAQEDLLALGLTDGLPVMPPTRKRVNDMLEMAGVDRNAVLGTLPPAFLEVTWEDVAINAVLAGCEPAYLPVVGAAIAAMTDTAFNLLGIATTTGSAATLVIVNGPVAQAIGMNSEANALGPGNKANATIGRAVRLVLQNVGGAKSGTTDMATLGQPAKYTFCFAENEAASPWAPLHVERGFAPEASVVTVVGTSGSIEVVDTVSAGAADLARTYAQSMLIAGNVSGAGTLGGGEPGDLVSQGPGYATSAPERRSQIRSPDPARASRVPSGLNAKSIPASGGSRVTRMPSRFTRTCSSLKKNALMLVFTIPVSARYRPSGEKAIPRRMGVSCPDRRPTSISAAIRATSGGKSRPDPDHASRPNSRTRSPIHTASCPARGPSATGYGPPVSQARSTPNFLRSATSHIEITPSLYLRARKRRSGEQTAPIAAA